MSEERRCIICDWHLEADMKDGCVPGNCSFRPRERSPEWERVQARRELVARIKAELLSTTEQSLASFKSRAERAEAVVEAASKLPNHWKLCAMKNDLGTGLRIAAEELRLALSSLRPDEKTKDKSDDRD